MYALSPVGTQRRGNAGEIELRLGQRLFYGSLSEALCDSHVSTSAWPGRAGSVDELCVGKRYKLSKISKAEFDSSRNDLGGSIDLLTSKRASALALMRREGLFRPVVVVERGTRHPST